MNDDNKLLNDRLRALEVDVLHLRASRFYIPDSWFQIVFFAALVLVVAAFGLSLAAVAVHWAASTWGLV